MICRKKDTLALIVLLAIPANIMAFVRSDREQGEQAIAPSTALSARAPHSKSDKIIKEISIPEIKLTKRINPVYTYFFAGSWQMKSAGEWSSKPLCTVDKGNTGLTLKSPESLLPGSGPCILNQSNQKQILNGITWGQAQSTHFVFNATTKEPLVGVVEIITNSKLAIYKNGKLAGEVVAPDILEGDGCAYIPIFFESGDNIINVKQLSICGPAQLQLSICFDNSRDFKAAWQAENSLLQKLVYVAGARREIPTLEWSPLLENLTVSVEVCNVATGTTVFKKEAMRRAKTLGNDGKSFTPGVYRIAYRSKKETAQEYFIVGNPVEIFNSLKARLSIYTIDFATKINVEAYLRRVEILLSPKHLNLPDRVWQEKIAYALGGLSSINHLLEKGAASISKDMPGLHIRGFKSNVDQSTQFYRLFVPSAYKPDEKIPLLVVAPTIVSVQDRPYIEGIDMASQRKALLWAAYAEKHGFALLWPGYRNVPEGYTYEALHIEEAIQAVEKDYNIDPRRISVFGTCSAGFNAGRLISEYPNRFAAVVYDKAMFNRNVTKIKNNPTLQDWIQDINPVPHVINNRNLRIFVANDGSRNDQHGDIAWSNQFLREANQKRSDIIHCLGMQTAGTPLLDTIFTWLAPCQNDKAGSDRSYFMSAAGYVGPISEVFGTSLIIVEGTSATGKGQENIRALVEHLATGYKRRFLGAQCVVKKDHEVTQGDIEKHSLVLIGNPASNGVWGAMQKDIPVSVTATNVFFEKQILCGESSFSAVLKHPFSENNYVLLIGAANLDSLPRAGSADLFRAWYDCCVFEPKRRIIGKLSAMSVSQTNPNLHDIQ